MMKGKLLDAKDIEQICQRIGKEISAQIQKEERSKGVLTLWQKRMVKFLFLN